ncbi:MAG: hypothetical protein COB14_03830 [Alphaproteobacteria bacterium]|nr:MAG: hypothetical protein COB14_03830 [Alphaproteobacteria bacterium]
MLEEEEDLGSMAWPGFVDILSSVIIMFVFFVLVVASALFFHIIIFKNKILSEMSEYTQASTSETVELADTNRFLMEKIEELESKLKLSVIPSDNNEVQLYQVNTEFTETLDQNIDELSDADGLIVFFGKDSISVTEENRVKLLDLIKDKSSPNTHVKIISSKDPNSINDVVSRKLAVSRMLNVRNLFLDGGIPIERVSPSLTQGEEIDNSYHWVKIIFEEQPDAN